MRQPALKRSAAARVLRINDFLSRGRRRFWGHYVVQCTCCPKFSRPDLVSARGWCPECEKEFRQVRAVLAQRELDLS